MYARDGKRNFRITKVVAIEGLNIVFYGMSTLMAGFKHWNCTF